MPVITKRRIRCGAKVNQPFASSPLTDFYNNQQIEAVQGNSTRFEFGFLTIAGEIYDISDVESLTLMIKTSQTVNTMLAEQTLAAEDLDGTLDIESWNDGTKSHAVFVFSNAEMNLSISGTRSVFWLVVTAILTDGSEVTLAAGGIIFHPDNNSTADPPPENPGTSITLEQADARYARLAPEVVSITADFTLAASDAGKIFAFPSDTLYFVSVPDDLPAGFLCQFLPVGQSVMLTPLGDSEINRTTSDVEIYQGSSLIAFHASSVGGYNVGNSMALLSICEILGIEIYTNLAAANTGIGEINRTYYDQALGRLNQTDAIS